MLEAEWAFTEKVEDVCQVVEGALKELLAEQSMEKSRTLLEVAGDGMDVSWPRMTYTEAIEALRGEQGATGRFTFEPKWGKSLQSEHERWIADELVRKPVFVTDYPASLKPFYMRMNDDGKTVACFDLLIPGLGELVGGSLREERYEMLEKALERHKLEREDYGWYLDLRRYGGAPHGGFGMGFERLISWLGGIDNIRESIAMPRWTGRMLL